MDSGALPIFLEMPLTVVLIFAITASRPVTDAIIDNGSMAREKKSWWGIHRSLSESNRGCDDFFTSYRAEAVG